MILCVVPLGILLGRIGNMLNQELIGKPLDTLAVCQQDFFRYRGTLKVYDVRDEQLRVNTNIWQSGLEGLLLLIISWTLLLSRYLKKTFFPGLIS